MSLRLDQYLSIGLLSLVLVSFGAQKQHSDLKAERGVLPIIGKLHLVTPIVRADSQPPEISALAAVVVDEASAAVLYEKNSQLPVAPASTTKLMTALVTRKQFALNQALTVPPIAMTLDGARAGLQQGERLSVHSLLKALLIQSGNDAAVTLASSHEGGIPGFVQSMNQEAGRLHLTATAFQNPIGYDAPGHTSTAWDLALLSREVMRDPIIRQIVGTPRDRISDTSGGYFHDLVSTHKLLGIDPTVVGVKTGTTEDAGEVLITQFKQREQSVVVVVMGSSDRYADTIKLMDYVARGVEWRELTDKAP
ncbi:D-alanyl-D-alanine carboxypeptidase [Candidatus Woesebacteria bacterium]|nr:D-alanyl-D-alanine carboxypeptidase [Candidatus Woesebacteria bacterium]